MSRIDEEDLVLGAIAKIKANYNTKIAAINAEKSDSATLKELNSSAYYFIDFPDAAPAYDPVLCYQIIVESTESPIQSSSALITVGLLLTFADELVADSDVTYQREARYRRALKELIKENVAPTFLGKIADYPGLPRRINGQNYYTAVVGFTMDMAN